jgi:hypothetical protein
MHSGMHARFCSRVIFCPTVVFVVTYIVRKFQDLLCERATSLPCIIRVDLFKKSGGCLIQGGEVLVVNVVDFYCLN